MEKEQVNMYEHLDLSKLLELNEVWLLEEQEVTQTLKSWGLFLPERVNFEKRKPEAIISKQGESLFVNNVDDYSNEDADSVWEHLKSLGYLIHFSGDLNESLPWGVFSPSLDENGVQRTTEDGEGLLSFHVNGTQQEDLFYSEFLDSLIAGKKFELNQDSFVKAHDFLIHHPTFWHRSRNLKHWFMDSGLDDMHVSVYEGSEDSPYAGEPRVLLEAGPYVEDDYVERYATPLLDVTAGTYEEAILILAKRVLMGFDINGEMTPEGDKLQREFYERRFGDRKSVV